MSKSAKFDSVFKKLINKMQKYNIKKLSSVMDGEVVFWAASIQKHKSREVSAHITSYLLPRSYAIKGSGDFLTTELFRSFP